MKLYEDKEHLLPHRGMNFHTAMTINEVISHLKNNKYVDRDICLFFIRYGFEETYPAYQVVDFMVSCNYGLLPTYQSNAEPHAELNSVY
jgi:hypothetical protein